MELEESNISCGLYELNDVGQTPSECGYRSAMRNCHAATVIASVPATWTKAIKFLKSKKFTQPLNKSRNPNSGNDIVILVRNFTEKQRKRLENARSICHCIRCGKTVSKCRCPYFDCSECGSDRY